MTKEEAEKIRATYVANIEKATGKKFDYWVGIVKKTRSEKHGELVNMLKSEYKITHGYANMIVHAAKGGFEAVKDTDNLITRQYKGKENLKPWYDKIAKEISKFGKDIEISPKKTYISFVRKKQFALIQPSARTRLDIGLNLKGEAPSGIAEDGKSWNAMCTHRIRVEDEKTIGKELFSLLKKAYGESK